MDIAVKCHQKKCDTFAPLVTQFGIGLVPLGHITWNPLKRNAGFYNKYSYKIEKAIQSNQKKCVIFVSFSNTIRRRFGVTGSHDIEAIETKC